MDLRKKILNLSEGLDIYSQLLKDEEVELIHKEMTQLEEFSSTPSPFSRIYNSAASGSEFQIRRNAEVAAMAADANTDTDDTDVF